jgi:beta-phosphoglucomutase-like phosphatase (HAD superfamily)
MSKLAQYLTPEEAAELVRRMAADLGTTEMSAVRNLDYVPAPYEVYALAPRVTPPLDHVAAFLVDMDGTSTTTEPLALHSLEYMVRRFTGRLTKDEWLGLDPIADYPHVIGNSNFRHTEFLVDRYEAHLNEEALREAFFEAVVWTLRSMTDAQRLRDIALDARNCGLGPMLDDPAFRSAMKDGPIEADEAPAEAAPWLATYSRLFTHPSRAALISAALDVYYYRYHSILRLVERGEGQRLSRELLGEAGRRLVEPMPGYAVFFALVKGALGEEAARLAPHILTLLPEGNASRGLTEADAAARLRELGRRYAQRPARIALVTASIAYETHATVAAIFDVMREQAEDWPVSADTRKRVLALFSDYRAAYDGFVCATDASEARLKPHRDLYTIALYQMSVPKDEYRYCVGLEDTEPGIISLRAAGVGCAVALPNHDTSRQDYRAAALTVKGGLPELMLTHNLMLRP